MEAHRQLDIMKYCMQKSLKKRQDADRVELL